MAKPIFIFVTPKDILGLLLSLEEKYPVKYVESGIKPSSAINVFSSADEIENLGISTKGDQAQEKTYLIAPVDSEIFVREVPQRNGEVLFSIDQRMNPGTLGICPAGLFVGNIIISGQVGPSTGVEISNELSTLLIKKFKGKFKKIKSYWVGEEALSFYCDGFRLTTNARAAIEYDLQI